MRKARELWRSLSLDEPENQARPDTLEQLVVMLARESARRLVHLVNYAGNGVSNLPRLDQHTIYIQNYIFQYKKMVDCLIFK